MKFQTKLMLNTIFLSILVIGLLAVIFNYAITEFYVREKFSTSHSFTEQKAAELRRELERLYLDISLLAEQKLLRQQKTTEQQLQEFVTLAASSWVDYEDISIITPSGRVIASSTYDFHGDWKSKLWFKQALDGEISISNVFLTLSPTRQVVEYVAPVLDDNKEVLYVLSIRFDFDSLRRALYENTNSVENFIFVSDKFGRFVLHPDKRSQQKFVAPQYEGVLEAENGIHEISTSDGKVIVSRVPITSSKSIALNEKSLVLYSVYNAEHFFATSSFVYWMFFIIGIVSLNVAVLGSFVLTRREISALKRLQKFAYYFGKGDLDSSVDITSKDEIGALAVALERMRKNLMQSRQQLIEVTQKKNDELQGAVRQATTELKKKVLEEENASRAMLFILQDLDELNHELEKSKRELVLKDKLLLKEKKSVEKKVVQRTSELEEEKKKVMHLLRQKEDFVNQLSHDLRTPITPLLSLLPLVKESVPDEAVGKDIDVCIRNARNLQRLVVDTLNLARLESGTIKFAEEIVDVAELLRDHVEDLGPVFKDENVHVTIVHVDSMYLIADKIRLGEVLGNLTSNALKFMTTDDKKLSLGAFEDDKGVVLYVKDNGSGISQEELPKIFDEFYKVDPSRHELGSSGLGLSICVRIVTALHGSIWAESEGLGKGTTFFVRLPKAKFDKNI